MKKEYEFSKGERDKLYKKNRKIYVPVYLREETMRIIEKIAAKKKKDVSTVVDELLKNDIEIMEYVK